MGIVSLWLSQSNNMKFLLVLAVAAYVKAEADPAFVYSTAGVIPHVLPYAHVAYPYVHAAPLAAGCTNNDGALVPCAHGLVAPVVAAAAAPAAAEAEAVETVAKREAEPVAEATAEADAEADPEADPWLYYSGLYGHGYGYHGYAPFAYSYAPYTYSHVYSHYGLPYAYYGHSESRHGSRCMEHSCRRMEHIHGIHIHVHKVQSSTTMGQPLDFMDMDMDT